jgi:hypothetical protein
LLVFWPIDDLDRAGEIVRARRGESPIFKLNQCVRVSFRIADKPPFFVGKANFPEPFHRHVSIAVHV